MVVFGPRRGDATVNRSDALGALATVVDARWPKGRKPTSPSLLSSGGLAVVVSQGLGVPILGALPLSFKTEILAAGGLAVGLAILADGLLVLAQRALTPWATARRAT